MSQIKSLYTKIGLGILIVSIIYANRVKIIGLFNFIKKRLVSLYNEMKEEINKGKK